MIAEYRIIGTVVRPAVVRMSRAGKEYAEVEVEADSWDRSKKHLFKIPVFGKAVDDAKRADIGNVVIVSGNMETRTSPDGRFSNVEIRCASFIFVTENQQPLGYSQKTPQTYAHQIDEDVPFHHEPRRIKSENDLIEVISRTM